MAGNSKERQYAEDLPSSCKWVNDNFVLGDMLGSGTFGRVYTVECRKDRQIYALKEISRGSQPRYVANELKVMQTFGGRHNLLTVHAAYRDRDRVFFVMDYFPHDSTKNLVKVMTTEEKLFYMKNLFIALRYLHLNKIIHRDVKPANFLYNRKEKRFALVDFGLSQEYTTFEDKDEGAPLRRQKGEAPSLFSDSSDRRTCSCDFDTFCPNCTSLPKKHINKAGTPGFRAPELLLKFDQQFQTPALDIWSAGVLFLGLIFRRHPVFRPSDDFQALQQMCVLLGSREVVQAAAEFNVNFQIREHPGVDIAKLTKCARTGVNTLNCPAEGCEPCSNLFYENLDGRCFCKSEEPASMASLSDDDRLCVEIVKRCLIADPTKRYSAKQLLAVMNAFP